MAAAVALGVPAGCGAPADTQRTVDRSRLVNDQASRLSRGGDLTFTAVYNLGGGGTVTVAQAQQPARAAYSYPQGRLILTPYQIADCRGAIPSAVPSPLPGTSPDPGASDLPSPVSGPASPGPAPSGTGAAVTCTLTAPPSPATDPVSTLAALPDGHGLIAPATVVNLLTATAVDANATIGQHDTTIAGQNATCLDVSGVSNAAATAFSACITPGGLLASFQGTVGGQSVDISLDQYDDRVADDAFDLPPGATVVDKRGS